MQSKMSETPGIMVIGFALWLIALFAIASAAVASTPHSGSDVSCVDCHGSQGVAPHGAAAPAVATHRDLLCTTCHDYHGETSNIELIWEVIATPNSGPRDVIFLQKIGANSYADGDTVYDGVCEVCHTRTRYHRNDWRGNHSHYAASQCVDCHTHDNGFDPTPVTAVIDDGSAAVSIRVFPSPSQGPVTVLATAPSFGREVAASIWDVNGRIIRSLEAEGLLGGKVVFRWDGRTAEGKPASSGVYFCVVDAGENQLQERFVLVR